MRVPSHVAFAERMLDAHRISWHLRQALGGRRSGSLGAISARDPSTAQNRLKLASGSAKRFRPSALRIRKIRSVILSRHHGASLSVVGSGQFACEQRCNSSSEVFVVRTLQTPAATSDRYHHLACMSFASPQAPPEGADRLHAKPASRSLTMALPPRGSSASTGRTLPCGNGWREESRFHEPVAHLAIGNGRDRLVPSQISVPQKWVQ
jgi:hypothetical protein